jgi:hypothetical protein
MDPELIEPGTYTGGDEDRVVELGMIGNSSLQIVCERAAPHPRGHPRDVVKI